MTARWHQHVVVFADQVVDVHRARFEILSVDVAEHGVAIVDAKISLRLFGSVAFQAVFSEDRGNVPFKIDDQAFFVDRHPNHVCFSIICGVGAAGVQQRAQQGQ